MKNRSIGWILTGVLLAGTTMLVAPGCSRSLASEYYKLCVSTCESGDDCEGYAGFFPVDREDCVAQCNDDADDFERTILNACDDDVAIDGAQVDRCNDAIRALGDYCRADDESEILEALGDIGDECQQGDLYYCN